MKVIFIKDFLKKGENMLRISDVADYFVYKDNFEKKYNMTQLKIQKLCYYSLAWSLAWNEKELFNQKFEAWVHGPANRNLYKRYKSYESDPIVKGNLEYDFSKVDKKDFKILNLVWKNYAHYGAKELENMTHQELPWIQARGNLKWWEHSNKIIDNKVIKDYYKQFI